ncbi:MAG: hypothetical protein AB7G93_13950 [Bdellovibrionales bacterium]
MKSINQLIIGISIFLVSNLARAETPEQAFWNSPEVAKRVHLINRSGFTQPHGATMIALKHEFRGPHGVFERSYLVTQAFVAEKFAYHKLTSITAIVKQNALGEMIDVNVVNLPKASPNDFNGGNDEN